MNMSGKPLIVVGGNSITPEKINETIDRGIPQLLLNTRKFSSKKPDSVLQAFNNVIEYCHKLYEKDKNGQTMNVKTIWTSILAYLHKA